MNKIPNSDPGNEFQAFEESDNQHDLSEKHILQLNRLYATLSQINQAIVRVHERDILFNDICTVSVDYGQFCLVWIGLADETGDFITPVAFAGNEQGYLENVRIAVTDQERGKGPTDADKTRVMACGCDDFVSKPINRNLLIAKLEEQLYK